MSIQKRDYTIKKAFDMSSLQEKATIYQMESLNTGKSGEGKATGRLLKENVYCAVKNSFAKAVINGQNIDEALIVKMVFRYDAIYKLVEEYGTDLIIDIKSYKSKIKRYKLDAVLDEDKSRKYYYLECREWGFNDKEINQ